MTRRTVNYDYWNKNRVKNGLFRLWNDFFLDREQHLPQTIYKWQRAVPKEFRKKARQLKLYPSFVAVMRHYDSLLDAWHDLGFAVEDNKNRQSYPPETEYWTKERVIEGLRKFNKDFNCCPTTLRDYGEKQQFTGKIVNGRLSNRGCDQLYPSQYGILKYFRTMRQAWKSANFEVNQYNEGWSEAEDWFILETAGVFPRTEVAAYMQRSEAAIKRRLYDLGKINSKNRWGITIHRASQLLGIKTCIIPRYISYGLIPRFRGNKYIFLNPADLLQIREVDWTQPQLPELENLIRKALIERICGILKYGQDWRVHEIYTFHKTKELRQIRVVKPNNSPFINDLPKPPNEFAKGQKIEVTKRCRMVKAGRLGEIKEVIFSPPTKPNRNSPWVAKVEFKKIKRINGGGKVVLYNLPFDHLKSLQSTLTEEKR